MAREFLRTAILKPPLQAWRKHIAQAITLGQLLQQASCQYSGSMIHIVHAAGTYTYTRSLDSPPHNIPDTLRNTLVCYLGVPKQADEAQHLVGCKVLVGCKMHRPHLWVVIASEPVDEGDLSPHGTHIPQGIMPVYQGNSSQGYSPKGSNCY